MNAETEKIKCGCIKYTSAELTQLENYQISNRIEMTNLNKTSLKGKFKNVIFLNASQEAKFSNIIIKEFDKTTDKSRAFELVQLAKDKNFPFAQKLEHQFNSKYHPNLQ